MTFIWELVPGCRSGYEKACCPNSVRAGWKKVNTVDECYLVGYTEDRHAEFIRRPLIVSALELCTPKVVDLLLNFGADLAKYHEGRSLDHGSSATIKTRKGQHS